MSTSSIRSAVMDWPAMMASMVPDWTAGSQGVPGAGDDLQLPAVGVADLLGDHHVIAVGIGAGDVGDGHGAVGVVHLGPVVGGVGALHAHGEHAVLQAGDGAGVHIRQILHRGDDALRPGGLLGLGPGAGLRVGGVSEPPQAAREAVMARAISRDNSLFMSHQPFQNVPRRFRIPLSARRRRQRRKNEPLCQAVHGKDGKAPLLMRGNSEQPSIALHKGL